MAFHQYNIRRFIIQYLGSLFGKASIQKLMYTLLYPLVELWETYLQWRKDRTLEIATTGQIISLENYMNLTFDPTDKRIQIISPQDYLDGWQLGLDDGVDLPYNVDSAVVNWDGRYLPYTLDDVVEALTISIPQELGPDGNIGGLNVDRVKGILNRYNTLGTLFEIEYED